MTWQRAAKSDVLEDDEREQLYVALQRVNAWRFVRKDQTLLTRGLRRGALLARSGDVPAGTHRIGNILSKYGPTRVVTSFGAADGGAMFVQWLRDAIMTHKGWKDRNAVYVDTFALADLPGTKQAIETVRGLDGTSRTAGRLTSGNEGWAEYYRYAMAMAETMVFVFTAAWFKSPWCGRELNYFIKENERRQHDGLDALKGIGLAFTDEGAPSSAPGLTTITAKKQYLVTKAKSRMKLQSAYRDAFIVDQQTLSRVLTSARLEPARPAPRAA